MPTSIFCPVIENHRRNRWRPALLLARGLRLAPRAWAQQQEPQPPPSDPQGTSVTGMTPLSLGQLLDPSITTASRTLERATEAPATVYVITSDDIRTRGYSTLA